MRLTSVKVSGYRRFQEASVNLDAALIALIGPNEAGKTSLLELLGRLEDEDPIDEADLTRGRPETLGPGHRVIECTFLLEADDFQALEDAGGVGEPRWFTVWKRRNGRLGKEVKPPLQRDPAPRTELVEALNRTLRNTHLTQLLNTEHAVGEEAVTWRARIERLLKAVKLDVRDQEEVVLTQAQGLLEGVGELTSQARRRQQQSALASVQRLLEAFLATEQAIHPTERAIGILDDRKPRILRFHEEDRELRSEYTLAQLKKRPRGLENLLAMAGVGIGELQKVVKREQHAERAGLQERAREALKTRFLETWGQSNVYPYLHLDQEVVRVHVRTRETFSPIAERSDGLRAFVAMVAFTERHRGSEAPILLLDEAERHLHYDAQADLIRVLENQQVASKVIYSTHSAGCLPSDLGRGIRAVVPQLGEDGTDTGRSILSSRFWSEGAGFSPLMFAMGASVLALVPTRRAVLTEGASDHILLPTLLKEVVHKEQLGFQVAPGIANVARSDVRALDLEAPRVAYLLDGDDGGREHARKLKSGGIPKESIFRWPSGRVLEDYVERSVYVAAVNEELRRSYGAQLDGTLVLPEKQRPRAVAEACARRGWDPPNKVRVAERILDLIREGSVDSIVDARRRGEVEGAARWIGEKLGVSLA